MQTLINFLWTVIQYCLDILLYLPARIWDFLVDQCLIPALQWVYSLVPTNSIDLSAIPSGVAYFLGVFQVQVGIAIIVGAYFVRFMIRRIPFIG